MRIMALSGSLNRSSSNSHLLRRAASSMPAAEIEVWDGLGQLPYFSPDAEADGQVALLRRAVALADVVWIATPEYAGGMPGALKNALDWLVGSGELYGKRVVVLSAAPSPQRGHNARRWVEEVARMQGAEVVDSFTVALPPGIDPAHLDAAVEAAVRRIARAGSARARRCGAGRPGRRLSG
jgi:chromate reductase, NAD(P)H dehydrogenase (quinone)